VKLLEARVGGFTKVMGVNKLRKKYHEFKDRRALVERYAAFYADDRIVPMIPKLCGKPFFSRRKLPMPVVVAHGDIAKTLSAARDSTWLVVGQQTCAFKVGRAHMTPENVAENIMAAIGPAVARLPGKWAGVQSINLRGVDTVSAPIYRATQEAVTAAKESVIATAVKEQAVVAAKKSKKKEADNDFFGDMSDDEEKEEEKTVAAVAVKTTKKGKGSSSGQTSAAAASTKAVVLAAAPAPAPAPVAGGKRPRPDSGAAAEAAPVAKKSAVAVEGAGGAVVVVKAGKAPGAVKGGAVPVKTTMPAATTAAPVKVKAAAVSAALPAKAPAAAVVVAAAAPPPAKGKASVAKVSEAPKKAEKVKVEAPVKKTAVKGKGKK
jgi:hypothetical protein